MFFHKEKFEMCHTLVINHYRSKIYDVLLLIYMSLFFDFIYTISFKGSYK